MRNFLIPLLMIMSTAAVAQEPEVASTRHADEQNDVGVELASGIEYEEGDYGTGTQISSLSVPVSVRVMTGHLQLLAILPYRRVEAPDNVVPGGLLGLPIIDPSTAGDERTVREGLGDLTLGAVYGVPTDVVDVTLSGLVKVPTADEGLGTGKTDYTVGAEISKTLGSGIIPFVGVSYTMPGDPEGYSLQNAYAFTAGLAAAIGSRARGYVSYRYTESLSPLTGNDQRLNAGLNMGIGDRLALGVFGAAGLSEGSPDVATGLRIGLALD